MLRRHLLLLAALVAAPAAAADPPKRGRLPVTAPIAITPPTASPVGTIKPGEWYVFDSDVPLIVLSSPEGHVKVTSEEQTCPTKIRGVFAGGSGMSETKTFGGKYLYTVEAVAAGRCELILIPVGVKDATEIERGTVDVEAGQGPHPPPNTSALYFLIVRPNGPADPAFTRVMGDPAWKSLAAKGHTYKDKTVDEARAFGIEIPETTLVPAVWTLRVKPNGKSEVVRGRVDFPTTADAIGKLPEGIR